MTMLSDPLDFLKDVDVRLSVELGTAQMKLRSVLALREDSVVVLDRLADELLDVMVNGQRIAHGEVVIEGNRFGLRIVEMAGRGGEGSEAPEDAPTFCPIGQQTEDSINHLVHEVEHAFDTALAGAHLTPPRAFETVMRSVKARHLH